MKQQLLITCSGVNFYLSLDLMQEVAEEDMIEGTAIVEITCDTEDDEAVESFKVLVEYENTLEMVHRCFALSGVLHVKNAIEYDEPHGCFDVESVEPLVIPMVAPKVPVVLYANSGNNE